MFYAGLKSQLIFTAPVIATVFMWDDDFNSILGLCVDNPLVIILVAVA